MLSFKWCTKVTKKQQASKSFLPMIIFSSHESYARAYETKVVAPVAPGMWYVGNAYLCIFARSEAA
jgi:hypothetical protein